jgi:sterol desaturase/sphingolipid hydroxylase (fatty acid hydroxylase superfamily)
MTTEDIWTQTISSLQESYPYLSDRLIFTLGTWILYLVVFWGENALLYLTYHFKMFRSFVIQPDKEPDRELVMTNLKEIVFSHLVLLPVLGYFLYDAFHFFGMNVQDPLPSTKIILRDMFVALVCADTLGYWGHRLAHHKALYKFVHKKHHEYKVTIGISSVYAHPVEDLCISTLATISGCMLMGSHLVVVWIWFAIRIFEAIYAHSGYHFIPYSISEWFSSGEFHEFHHSHNVGNYGAFTTIWDKLMGTEVAFQEYLKKKKETQRVQLMGDEKKRT